MKIEDVKDEVLLLRAMSDEHGFVARVNLPDGLMAAVELSLFGAARLHVFRAEMLGKASDRVYDYDGPVDAFAEMLRMGEGHEPKGYRRMHDGGRSG